MISWLFGICVLSFTSYISANNCSVPESLKTLRQVHLIFRHGERTPASTYPLDPHKDEKFDPYGWGQLTNNGKRQQYEQGQWLHDRYAICGELLIATKYVEVITTDTDRTKMSAQLMLAGFLPPVKHQIWNPNLLWQPFPSLSQKLDEDKLLLVRGCPRYSEALNDLLKNNKKIQGVLKKESELYKYLANHTGMEVNDPRDVEDIYSTLKAEEDFGLKLPEWTKEVYPEKMKASTAFSYTLKAYNEELQKIKGGPLLNKIVFDSDQIASNKQKTMFHIYATHDSTISSLLLTMGVWDEQIPVYNSLIIIELHETVDHLTDLRVYLRNTTNHEPYRLKICEDEVCQLEKMQEKYAKLLPVDINETCKAKDDKFKPEIDGHP